MLSFFRNFLYLTSALLAGWGSPGAQEFWFQGPEIFPLDRRMHSLQAVDLNGDERLDVVLVNNQRSRIQLLYNRTGDAPPQEPKPLSPRELNELPPDARFKLDSLHSEHRITSLLCDELTGDELVDIAYCGDQTKVVVLKNLGKNQWRQAAEWNIPDIVPAPEALQFGDFRGNGRRELILLTESHLYFLPSLREESPALPRRMRHGGKLNAFQTGDLDGDGSDDVLGTAADDPSHLYVALGGTNGLTASETLVKTTRNRFLKLFRQPNQKRAGLLTVSQKSGRASIMSISETDSTSPEDARDGLLNRLGLPSSRLARRGLTLTDLDGDKLTDVVVADVEAGKILVHRQTADGRYRAAAEFSSFSGIEQIEASDWDRNGTTELFCLSSEEKLVGVTSWDPPANLPFPRTIDIGGVPVGIALGPLTNQDSDQLLTLVRTTDSGTYRIHATEPDFSSRSYDVDLDFLADRVKLIIHDIDQDGRNDLVLLRPYETMHFLRQLPDGAGFETLAFSSGLRAPEHPWTGSLDVDEDGKPELILPQKNAVRAVVARPRESNGDRTQWVKEIKMQINGAESDSKISGMALLHDYPDDTPLLCLLDTGKNQLSYLRSQPDGQWQILRNFEFPQGDYSDLQALGTGGSPRPALLLNGLEQLIFLSPYETAWKLTAQQTYESSLKDARLSRCLITDFNQDGLTELIFLETSQHNLEIATIGQDGEIQLNQRWPVFESRTFRGQRDPVPEPREVLARDFTGDGLKDLMLLVHDRILLYPQTPRRASSP